MNPPSGDQSLERFFLEARAKILELAAILDRVDRGGGTNDKRLTKLREALAILHQNQPGRAERVQQHFSLSYDPRWQRP